MPQGPVLGPFFLLINISDIDNELHCKMSTFSHDTKLENKPMTEPKSPQLQTDRDKVINWAYKWQIYFDIHKCKVPVGILLLEKNKNEGKRLWFNNLW